jgi:hypothetical protein
MQSASACRGRQPGEGETCQSILEYLNNPQSAELGGRASQARHAALS